MIPAARFTALRQEHVERLASELPRIVERLKDLGAERVILFGSYARGRRDYFTDLDLIAIMESDLPFIQRLAYIRREVSPVVETDLLVYTPNEFEAIKGRRFFRHALSDAKVLYARR